MSFEILTSEQMQEADRLTIKGGTPGFTLMERAAEGVADAVKSLYKGRKILILCGPGNNGGDGFVIARLLKGSRFAVRVACLVKTDKLKGDAAEAAKDWKGLVLPFEKLMVGPDDVIVDAVFGTGFSENLKKPVTDVFGQIKKLQNELIAVDIPSGVNGSTGEADPLTPNAKLTVTFFRKKVGHMLLPGMALCGKVKVIDIGVVDNSLDNSGYAFAENQPGLWETRVKPKAAADNKYDHGHVLVFGGGRLTGAACLAAHAALRVGAGLCTISSMPETMNVYRSYLPNIMVEQRSGTTSFYSEMKDTRRNAILIGPGAGVEDADGLRQAVLDVCRDGRPCVLDADALTVFGGDPDILLKALGPHCVLTPHEGEFARIFPGLKGIKTDRAAAAAKKSKAIILLKGADTVIAAPDGRLVVSANAPPDLATGGAGDVLAGLIAGLLARHVSPFEAACAGAWIEGRAAAMFGPGLMATDLFERIPLVLREFA
jgi:ADP-dependent NAD(P)H-hydrate dehydratase / NAD(P)H-hydrate epimerase